MAGLSDLDFAPGLEIESLISHRYGSPVCPLPTSTSAFFLVASFGRSAIRLNVDSVSLILQSCLGREAKLFRVSHLADVSYRFSVCSKEVGFMVFKLRHFKCASFAIFFDLWRSGGPNWIKELAAWESEQEAEWTHVSRKSIKKSFAQAVRSSPPNPGPRRSVFSRLSFASDGDAMRAAGVSPSSRVSYDPPDHRPPSFPENRRPTFPIPNSKTSKQSLGRNPRDALREGLLKTCFRCLAPGHFVADCTNEIRRRVCFWYGHLARSCRARTKSSAFYRPKSAGRNLGGISEVSSHRGINIQQFPSTDHPLASSVSPRHPPPSPSPPPPPPPAGGMANFAVDPRPHAPRGFEVLPHDPNAPPLRLFAYLGSGMDALNDDVAVAVLFPAVAKEDYHLMEAALKDYFIHNHNTRLAEVQPCALRDAYVRFMSPLERERFLDRQFVLSPDYQLHFIKHDEAVNARMHDLDREAWVMLMGYPLDARTNTAIAKAVAGFGLLRHWHDTNYKARIVVCVYLNDDAKIPNDVTVSVGLPLKVRSWTCPIFALKRKSVVALADEDPLPSEGPLHPLPQPWSAPRWMGPNSLAPSSVDQEPGPILAGQGIAGAGGGVHDDAMSDVQANHNAVDSKAAVKNQELSEAVSPRGGDVAVHHAVAGAPLLDQLVQKPTRVLIGPAAPGVTFPLVPYGDDEDSDDEPDVQEIQGPLKTTPSKRRSRMMKEPLERVFLRRSKRLNPLNLGGFRNEASAAAAADIPDVYADPLAIIPPEVAEEFKDDAPPFLPLVTIQGMATGFLQMQPSAVSAAAILELDDDDSAM